MTDEALQLSENLRPLPSDWKPLLVYAQCPVCLLEVKGKDEAEGGSMFYLHLWLAHAIKIEPDPEKPGSWRFVPHATQS